MQTEFELSESDNLGYYITFEELFPLFSPYLEEKAELIEVSFSFTDEDNQPNDLQLAANDFLLKNADEMLENLVKYLKQDEEFYLEYWGVYKKVSYEYTTTYGNTAVSTNEYGFPVVDDLYDIVNYFSIGTIFISDGGEDGVSYIGFSGGCTWEQEHGFGASFHKLELMDVDDWDAGYHPGWGRRKAERLLSNKFTGYRGLETLPKYKERLEKSSQDIQVENPEAYEEIFDWLVKHKKIYGCRNRDIDFGIKEKIYIINEIDKLSFLGDEIVSVPDSIALLKNVRCLEMTHNKLETFPNQILNLNLVELLIQGNEFKSIPKEISNLKKLESLSLISNKLASIPAEIGELPNLKKLNLVGNQLTDLPFSLAQLDKLEDLRLGNNSLTVFPSVIMDFKNLVNLELNGNAIEKIPESIIQLKTLQKLDLKYNQLKLLPNSFLTQMESLKGLYVVGNQFLSEDLENLKNKMNPEIKSDIDMAISFAKSAERRRKQEETTERMNLEKENAKRQEENRKLEIQNKIDDNSKFSKRSKQVRKKWWEFWR